MKLEFKEFNKMHERFDDHVQKIKIITKKVEPFKEYFEQEFSQLNKYSSVFQNKINDFFKEGRKLRLGIMGQVKAGKSSFLNAFLFEGKNLLPKAPTPKTANLTIITYGEKNCLEVEYYSSEEWKELQMLALMSLETDEVKVARELIAMAKKNDINPAEILSRKIEIILFESYHDLVGKLNDYSGENGKFTPVVKFTKILINDERLKDLEIIDTPGMNDPVLARTQKTKECMNNTDAVIFMSYVGSFLDKTDIDLLIRQLPSKGVKKMTLLSSKFDSGIIDDGWNRENFESTLKNIKSRILNHARIEIGKQIKVIQNNSNKSGVVHVLRDCEVPIFISSMAKNLSRKQVIDYDEEETYLIEQLNSLWPGSFTFDRETLEKVANFEEFEEKFQAIVASKDATLTEKCNAFIPDSINEITDLIDNILKTSRYRVNILSTKDLSDISIQLKGLKSKKNGVSEKIENILGTVISTVENKRIDITGQIRKSIQNFSNLTERSSSEEVEYSTEESASKWWNPFSWGTTRTVWHSRTVSYRYIEASEAIEKINFYANDAVTAIECSLNEIVKTDEIKKNLKTAIIEKMDAGSVNFDPDYFKLIIEKTINKIRIPVFKINISEYTMAIANNFSGVVRDGMISNLKLTLSNSLSTVFEMIEREFENKIKEFSTHIEELKKNLCDSFFVDMVSEITKLEEGFKNKENEVAKYNAVIKEIEETSKLLNANLNKIK